MFILLRVRSSWRVAACAAILAGSPNGVHAQPRGNYAGRPEAWYQSDEGKRIADNIVSWQSDKGSWPKNGDTTTQPNPDPPEMTAGTFDNGATIGEMRFLARAFRATQAPRYGEAFFKGFDAILAAQYETGGWPQSYPPGEGYHRHITFNDGTMIGLMELLREIATREEYAFVEPERREKASAAFERGVACILKCQIEIEGKLTAWCAQHDEIDFGPRPARTYEHASISGSESVGIIRLLMSLPAPSPEVVRAVDAAVAWFDSAKIMGIRVANTAGPDGGRDRVVVEDPAAGPLWARFYDIKTGRLIFSGRDGVIKATMAEIEQERRAGYAWYGNWGASLPREHAAWKERLAAAPSEAPPPAQPGD
jgi:pectate lyase